jgi:hemerythrin superfamily protein
MKKSIAFEDAVDLLDADHKSVKKLFITYNALCDDMAPAKEKEQLARQICEALTIHARIEEEIFYPKVREAIGDDALMDEALQEHGEAKETIARIEGMSAGNKQFDSTVKQLGKLIDEHVLEEREQIFLRARYSALDLRGLTIPLLKRKEQLKNAMTKLAKEAA